MFEKSDLELIARTMPVSREILQESTLKISIFEIFTESIVDLLNSIVEYSIKLSELNFKFIFKS